MVRSFISRFITYFSLSVCVLAHVPGIVAVCPEAVVIGAVYYLLKNIIRRDEILLSGTG